MAAGRAERAQKQPKRGRLWLADGSCVRRRPTYRYHVWAYDFVAERTHDGRPVKILAVVDEYSRECLALVVARQLRSIDVLETLAGLFVAHGVPAHIRSDNGPEFTATLVRLWLEALDVETLFIEPGSPWENGYVESFNGKLRDELLDREIFFTVAEAKILIERWRREYNTVRAPQRAGLPPTGPTSDHAGDAWKLRNESSSLIRTGSTVGAGQPRHAELSMIACREAFSRPPSANGRGHPAAGSHACRCCRSAESFGLRQLDSWTGGRLGTLLDTRLRQDRKRCAIRRLSSRSSDGSSLTILNSMVRVRCSCTTNRVLPSAPGWPVLAAATTSGTTVDGLPTSSGSPD